MWRTFVLKCARRSKISHISGDRRAFWSIFEKALLTAVDRCCCCCTEGAECRRHSHFLGLIWEITRDMLDVLARPKRG